MNKIMPTCYVFDAAQIICRLNTQYAGIFFNLFLFIHLIRKFKSEVSRHAVHSIVYPLLTKSFSFAVAALMLTPPPAK